MRTKTTVYLGDEDRGNITILKEKHGDMTDAEAIRLALRIASKQPRPRTRKEKQPSQIEEK